MTCKIRLRTTVPSQLSTDSVREVSTRRYFVAFPGSWLVIAICLTALTMTASAGPITLVFSDSISCPVTQECNAVWYGAGRPFLQVGDTDGGSGEIAVLSGPNANYTVSNGLLGFTTAPAYQTWTGQDGPGWDYQDEFGAGGSFSVTGSVFGLAPGSTLIAGYFLDMGCSGYWEPLSIYNNCSSDIGVSYINPAILQGLGLPPNLRFTGTLGGTTTFAGYFGLSSSDEISITSIPTPEPATLVLAGWGLILIALPHLRRH